MTSTWLWIGFHVVIFGMLALDLGVFHRKSHVVSVREAATWSVVWISLALLFGGGIYLWQGPVVGMEWLTGYVIEKSLSLDNIFVFVLIFAYFKVPRELQHRVLFWGVLGALAMRAGLIFAGSALLERFHWIIYVFGAFLVVTGVKMAWPKQEESNPGENIVVRLVRRLVPVTSDFHGEHFFVREAGRRVATPLFLVLMTVESSDLIFAVDSIPAIFAVTKEPFVVYTSNVFAIMGLRSLYFLLAGVIDKFRFLKLGLAVILTFVGSKMLLVAAGVHVEIWISLVVILGILILSIGASLLIPAPGRDEEQREVI